MIFDILPTLRRNFLAVWDSLYILQTPEGKILKFFKKNAVPPDGTTSIFDDLKKEDMH